MRGHKQNIRNFLSRLKQYKPSITPAFWLPFLAGSLVVVFFTLTLLLTDPGSYTDELGITSDKEFVTMEETPRKTEPVTMKEQVKAGQSMYSILTTKGLTPAEADHIAKQLKGSFSIKSFRPGQEYETQKSSTGSFLRFTYAPDRQTTIHVEKDGQTGRLMVRRETIGYETRTATLEGRVTNTLSKALRLNERSSLLGQLKPLFSSRIDFVHDIKSGTKYRILFEEKWLKNEFDGTGKILAAEFVLANHTYRAYRYTDSRGKSGYFDEDGHALDRTALFIQPCNYSHISSGFGYRIHPIRRTLHFHGGVDMAASSGTPVHAVADGKIIFLGRKGGAGNMVTLAHANGYYSQYLHLSRYTPSSGYGTRVHQGDIIGYVGSTGSSTGPHLDFRVIRNGKPMNPIAALASSGSGTIARTEMRNFLASINSMNSQLERGQILVAGIPQRRSVALL